jgi:hypothetical protein
MTCSHINRRTATVLTAALALGTAGPAAAQPIGDNGPVHVAPPMQVAHYGTPPATVSRAQPAGSSDVIYIVVGGLVVALSGLGGTLAVANRRRTAPVRPTIAA